MSDHPETARAREDMRDFEMLRGSHAPDYQPGNVERQVDRLHTVVQDAHERVSRLESRLRPVRLLSPEVAGEGGMDPAPPRSELADRIADACTGVEQLIVRLANLHDEVDL